MRRKNRKEKIFLNLISVLIIFSVVFDCYGGQALLIGVSTYPESPLLNPVNDVKLISKSLSSKGWATRIIFNPNSDELKSAVRSFYTENKFSSDPTIIYFSGHGMQYKGENYLLPTDIQGSKIILNKAISITEISYYAKESSGPKIFIIDACRSSPLGKDSIAVSTGLNSQYAPPNSLIAYATAPGEVALDGVAGANSPYAKAFSNSIDKYNSLDDIFKKTRFETMMATGGRQLPWESSSLYQDVLMSSKNNTVGQNNSNITNRVTPHIKFENSIQLGMPNITNINQSSFSSALESLRLMIEKAPQSSFLNRNGESSDERDRSDYVASIQSEKIRYKNNPSGVAFKIISALQSGVFYPNCKKGDFIDNNCGDFDRFFRFTPNLKLSFELSKLAHIEKIRSDKLANHYMNGWGVDKDLIKAYDLYESDKFKGGVVAEYWWTNINSMVQVELKNLGYQVSVDGDFGASSCRALSDAIGKTSCGRVVSKSQLISLVNKSTRYYN